MPKIKLGDMRIIDKALGMGSGYVLNFSDRTYSQFFDSELQVDIDEQRYHAGGSSKAKRQRRDSALAELWNGMEGLRETYRLFDRHDRPGGLASVSASCSLERALL